MFNAILRVMSKNDDINRAIDVRDIDEFKRHLKAFEVINKTSAYEQIAILIIKHLHSEAYPTSGPDRRLEATVAMLKLLGESTIRPRNPNWSDMVDQLIYMDPIGSPFKRRKAQSNHTAFHMDDRFMFVLDSLIQYTGFDINARDEDSISLLMYAVAENSSYPEDLIGLVDRGADVDALSDLHGKPIHFLNREKRNAVELMTTLMDLGADPGEEVVFRPFHYRNRIEFYDLKCNNYMAYLKLGMDPDLHYSEEQFVEHNVGRMQNILSTHNASRQSMQHLMQLKDSIDTRPSELRSRGL